MDEESARQEVDSKAVVPATNDIDDGIGEGTLPDPDENALEDA